MPLNSRNLSISVVATLMLQPLFMNAAYAKSVIGKNAIASATSSSGVNSTVIASILSSANYLNLKASVISTSDLKPLYNDRSNQPIFISGFSATAQLGNLKALINRVHLLGLDKEDYSNGDLDSACAQLSNAQSALECELLAAQAVVNIGSDLAVGRVELRSLDQETDFRKSKFTGHAALNRILTSGNLQYDLAQLEPQHDQYRQLKRSLEKLYSVKANGGWKSLSGAATLTPGKSSADVPAVRQRLADLNYFFDRNSSSTVYDSELVAAVKLFQTGMKLDADGICGKMCFSALKVSLDQRIAQIAMNLERLRWLPKSLGDKYVFVNLARQELVVMENGYKVMGMKTVAGRMLRRTPTMVDKIYEIILNPYWTSPNSIAIKDLIPAQRRDPGYLAKSHIRVLDANKNEISPYSVDWNTIGNRLPFTLRQDPGPHNSLGTVKFSLTNSRAIYLHDTPHPEDFPLTTRLKSSGCVRLERPHELAEYLLRGTGYDSFQIQSILSQYMTNPAHTVRLKQSVPTYLAYLTASVGELGEVQFTPDYYGQDERMLNVSNNKNGF